MLAGGLEGEVAIEGGDAVSLRGRNGEPPADVVQCPLRKPAEAVLNRVQRGKEQIAPRAGFAPAQERDAPFSINFARAAGPRE